MADSKSGDPPERWHHISDDDKAWARRRMKERGLSGNKLAKMVGMSRQNIYLIVNGPTRHSPDWPEIVAALGGTPPGGVPIILDERLRELARRWPELSESDRQLVEQIARRFSTKKT